MKKVLCIAALVAFMAPAAVTTVSAKAEKTAETKTAEKKAL